MIKRLLTLCLLLSTVLAQDGFQTLYTNPYSIQAAQLMPSRLYVSGGKRVHIALPSARTWLRNTEADYTLAAKFLSGEYLDETEKQAFLSQLDKDVLKLGMGANILALGGAYQLTNEQYMTFSFDVTDRAAGTFHIGKPFLKFMLEGNKHTIGKEVELATDINISAWWLRQYAVGWATDVPVDIIDGARFRFGVRAKLLTAHFGVQLKDAQASIYTDPDGEYIQANYDYEMFLSQKSNGTKSHGMGWGMDLSLEGTFSDRLRIGAAVLDLGKVRFNKDVELYKGKGNATYDQLIVGSLFWDDRFTEESKEKKQTYPLAPDTLTAAAFNSSLPTRVIVNAQYGLGDLIDTTAGPGMAHYKHNLYLTAMVPFGDFAGQAAIPRVGVGYMYALWHNLVNLGVTAHGGGYNKYGFGVFGGVNTGGFSATIGTENLIPLFKADAVSGGDLTLNLGLYF